MISVEETNPQSTPATGVSLLYSYLSSTLPCFALLLL
jgi:hypothetical protein